jgi:hypothetical protein
MTHPIPDAYSSVLTKFFSVHLAYGNNEFLQRRWAMAQRSYGECLRIAVQEMPTHPITAAAYYSLACVEFAQDHAEVAKYVYPWEPARSIPDAN